MSLNEVQFGLGIMNMNCNVLGIAMFLGKVSYYWVDYISIRSIFNEVVYDYCHIIVTLYLREVADLDDVIYNGLTVNNLNFYKVKVAYN